MNFNSNFSNHTWLVGIPELFEDTFKFLLWTVIITTWWSYCYSSRVYSKNYNIRKTDFRSSKIGGPQNVWLFSKWDLPLIWNSVLQFLKDAMRVSL